MKRTIRAWIAPEKRLAVSDYRKNIMGVIILLTIFLALFEVNVFFLIPVCALGYIFLILSIRRLHDSGHSGLWLLATPVPLLNLYLVVLLAWTDGMRGSNIYGEDPLLRDSAGSSMAPPSPRGLWYRLAKESAIFLLFGAAQLAAIIGLGLSESPVVDLLAILVFILCFIFWIIYLFRAGDALFSITKSHGIPTWWMLWEDRRGQNGQSGPAPEPVPEAQNPVTSQNRD